MHPARRVQPFAERFPSAGPLLWVSCIQFFVVQLVVASAWSPPYSWRLDAISDLGATSCGQFDGRGVCSPLHGLMNSSLMLLGLCMVVGSVLLHRAVRRSRSGFWLMAASGVGAILVGVFPEDTVLWAHITGQDLAFLCGNTALIVLGSGLGASRWFRWYSTASGVVALVGLYLFLSQHRFFLELGGMERVVAYPLTIWLVVCGLHMLTKRGRSAAADDHAEPLPRPV